jgi:steroid 5-alpha reductase family enzyme
MPWLHLLAAAALIIFLFVSAVWILSLIKKDAGIMDIFWGIGFIATSTLYAILGEGYAPRKILVLILVLAWGLRLSIHIAVRNHGQPEDARYREWRKKGGPAWWWKSYLKVFLLQGLVMLIVSLPLLFSFLEPRPGRFTLLDGIGLLLWLTGFFFEAVGDWQLLKFKRDPASAGKILTRGLWAYTRHPNYFGETLVWWGFFLIALSTGRWAALVSPVLMTFLLLKVSGVTLLEKTMAGGRPGYQDYIRRTSAFIPWFKKS